MATQYASSIPVYKMYRVSVEEYRLFREQGFLVVKSLVPRRDVEELNKHMDDLLAGRIPIEGSDVRKDLGIKPKKTRRMVKSAYAPPLISCP